MHEVAGSNGSTALAVVKPVIEPVSNSMEANVGVLMRRATDVASVCREIVMKTSKTIAGKRHVCVEGWQAIAVAYGCVLSARDVERVDGGGVRAIGEVRRMSDGVVIATGEGFVGMDEKKWAEGPEYARRAMAQTRSMSRAGRSAFSFMLTLIDNNLMTTPAEEMDGVTVEGNTNPPAPSKPKTLGEKLGAPQRPSPPQSVGAAVSQHANEPPAHTDADFRPDSAENKGAAPTHDRKLSFRFGRDSGVTLAELSEASLRWYANCLTGDIAKPEKANFAGANTLALANVQAELRYRGL